MNAMKVRGIIEIELLVAGAAVLVLLFLVGTIKILHAENKALGARATTAEAANVSLKKSCDKTIATFEKAQSKWATIAKANPKRAEAVAAATKAPEPKAALLEQILAQRAPTKEAQCEQATRIGRELAADSMPDRP